MSGRNRKISHRVDKYRITARPENPHPSAFRRPGGGIGIGGGVANLEGDGDRLADAGGCGGGVSDESVGRKPLALRLCVARCGLPAGALNGDERGLWGGTGERERLALRTIDDAAAAMRRAAGDVWGA